MYLPLYIAKRYFLSKKSTNAINIISFISVIGVAVTTAALVVILSGFNGFVDLVANLFTNFDPQIKVEAVKGKYIASDDPIITKIKKLPSIKVATECVTENALAMYQGHQLMVTLKGVQNNFDSLTNIKDILYGDGEFKLNVANLDYATVGIGVAQSLNLPINWENYLKLYAPNRKGQYDITSPTNAFVSDSVLSPKVVFQVKQSKYDRNYIIVPISLTRRMFNLQGELTFLEIRLKAGEDIEKTKDIINEIGKGKIIAKDRYEQQAETFNIMYIEKLFAYTFLSFILLVACFNIIGSLSMLMLDKKKDIKTLVNIGLTEKQVSKIFLFEGNIISIVGAIIGIIVGLFLCWIQQVYGIVHLGGQDSNFIINAYPISVHPTDIILIFITAIIISSIAILYPVKYMSKRLIKNTE